MITMYSYLERQAIILQRRCVLCMCNSSKGRATASKYVAPFFGGQNSCIYLFVMNINLLKDKALFSHV